MTSPRRLHRLAFSLLIFAVPGCAASWEPGNAGADFVLASLNIHYLSVRNDRTAWTERRDAVALALEAIDADIMLFQEMETFGGSHASGENVQLDWVLTNMEGFRAAAIGAGPIEAGFDYASISRSAPNTQPILYRISRFEFLDEGFRFFSPTPEVAYSRPWDGGHPSFLSWVRLRDLNLDREIVVVNLHFDAFERQTRLKSAKLVAEFLPSISGGAQGIVVAGDFNAPRFSRTVRTVRAAGLEGSLSRGATFHFNRGFNLFPAIDHILAGGDLTVLDSRRYRERPGGVYPSDHYPVVASLAFIDPVDP